MSTEKHTPGPWRLGNTNSVVCDSDEGTWGDEDNRSHYGGALVAESIRTEANARLIAAAPELLAALETALPILIETEEEWGGGEDCYTSAIMIARAAIAKALGN